MPKLRINVTHTHAGVVYSPGHILEVDEYSARWLIEHAIGTVANDDPPAPVQAPIRPARSLTIPKE